MRLSVVSDIHGNGRALQAAINEVSNFCPDRVVILGDLLTYGPDVDSVLDAIEDLAARYPTDWVLGNHEELYFNLAAGDTSYVDTLPEWLQQTVYWTSERLNLNRLASYPWQRHFTCQSIYFSHANPWGSWRYIQTDDDYHEARLTLQSEGVHAGVFGHTHRCRFFLGNKLNGDQMKMDVPFPEVAVVNAGSVGQPRNENAESSILNIDASDSVRRFQLVYLDYDTQAHIAAIGKLHLPQQTRDRLASFFVSRSGKPQ